MHFGPAKIDNIAGMTTLFVVYAAEQRQQMQTGVSASPQHVLLFRCFPCQERAALDSIAVHCRGLRRRMAVAVQQPQRVCVTPLGEHAATVNDARFKRRTAIFFGLLILLNRRCHLLDFRKSSTGTTWKVFLQVNLSV